MQIKLETYYYTKSRTSQEKYWKKHERLGMELKKLLSERIHSSIHTNRRLRMPGHGLLNWFRLCTLGLKQECVIELESETVLYTLSDVRLFLETFMAYSCFNRIYGERECVVAFNSKRNGCSNRCIFLEKFLAFFILQKHYWHKSHFLYISLFQLWIVQSQPIKTVSILQKYNVGPAKFTRVG